MSKPLNTAIDVKPKGVGKNPAAESLEEQYARTQGYLKKYPNGRVNLKGHKDVIRLRFETFRQTGVQPPLNLALVEQLHIGVDDRFWLIGRRDPFDQAQYVNPGGWERDGHCGLSAIHVMAIPRNDTTKQEVIVSGVGLHRQNLDIIDHMKRTFMTWWEKDKAVRDRVIWHQARTILSTYQKHLSDIALGQSKRPTDQKVDRAEAGRLARRFLALQEETGISKTQLRLEDMPRWDRMLVALAGELERDTSLDVKKKPWTHPASRLLETHKHYTVLKKWEREGQIRPQDFDFALHLPPDNTINYLHLHIFLAPRRFREWSVAIWDWSYKSADEVVEVAREYPGPARPRPRADGAQKQLPVRANPAAAGDARKPVPAAPTTRAAVQPQGQGQQSGNAPQKPKAVVTPQTVPAATRNVATAGPAQQIKGPPKTTK